MSGAAGTSDKKNVPEDTAIFRRARIALKALSDLICETLNHIKEENSDLKPGQIELISADTAVV